MKRDVGLKPRESKPLPPEKLRQILGRIYPPEIADELTEKLLQKAPEELEEKDDEPLR